MRGDVGKLIGALVGVGLCLVALTAWRLPTSGSPPGLDLRLIAVPPGELTVAPTGVIASARAMQSGEGPVRGEISVRNISGRRILIRPLALPSSRELAGTVRLRVAAAGSALADGTLASLQQPRGTGVEIAPRGSRRLQVAAWLPPGASGYRGHILDVTLELHAVPVGEGG